MLLDVEPMSKMCKTCHKHEQDDKTSPAHKAWKADHSLKCQANYKGSGMEPVGAITYVNEQFYGDGDSKSYAAIKNIHKEHNITVVKKECVRHVQKRLGTALRKMKKEKKGFGGKGKLTDAMIDKLQNYYGIAIRNNSGNLTAMKKAIYI